VAVRNMSGVDGAFRLRLGDLTFAEEQTTP